MSEKEQNRLKKSFGHYRSSDVDLLLERMETEHRQELEALQAELTQMKSENEERDRLAESYDSMKTSSDRLQKLNSRLAEENDTLNAKLDAQTEETARLRGDLNSARQQVEELRTELDMIRSQAAILGNRIARQRKELEEKDRLLLQDPVGEANARAEQIVQNAMNISQKMIDDAENVRSRALAAVRSAYFNAMGFRQNIEERFIGLEHDLDRSLGMLRNIESSEASTVDDWITEAER